MKLSKQNIFCYHLPLLLLTMVFSVISCKKEEPPKYSTDNFLYFITVESGTLNSTTINTAHQAEKSFSSLVAKYQVDTMVMNQAPGFPLSIQAEGRLSDKPRKILVEAEGDGKQYCVLPPADSMYIPANGIEYKLKLKLVRPPVSDTGMKTITLTLRNNDGFSPEGHIWHTVTYKFGNWFDIPENYAIVKASTYGDFSAIKMDAIQKAVSGVAASSWEADPNVITLNNFLKGRGQRLVKFNPFSLYELYYFVDLCLFIRLNAATGPVNNAYQALAKSMVTLTRELIVEKRNAGQPILDGSGNEISFP